MAAVTLMWTVLCAATLVSAAPTIDITTQCKSFGDILVDFAHAYQRQLDKMGRGSLNVSIDYIGYDLSDDDDVRTVACKLTGVKSVKDLSSVLNSPYQLVEQYYEGFVAHVAEVGGRAGYQKQADINLALAAAIQRFNFPTFPLKNTGAGALRRFFATMVTRYGANFLKGEPIGLDLYIGDPDKIAAIFARAKNLKELAAGLHLDYEDVVSGVADISNTAHAVSVSREVISKSKAVLQKLDELGLLILQ